jgi:glucose dehydrogenase
MRLRWLAPDLFRDAGGEKYSPIKDINRDNVSNLRSA